MWRQIVRLQAVTLVWMVVECALALFSAWRARSPVLLAFGADSLIELLSAPRDKAEWQKGSIEDWVMEGHRLAQTVAYGSLSNENPAPITPAFERQADAVIEVQLEKAGVRLAHLLNYALR